jgi:hypothetical protein
VRLRVTCDFGLWRRRGEKRSRRETPAHFRRRRGEQRRRRPARGELGPAGEASTIVVTGESHHIADSIQEIIHAFFL